MGGSSSLIARTPKDFDSEGEWPIDTGSFLAYLEGKFGEVYGV
jgi:hypothetical protein